jgi:FtsP/CotA-like multicopper oxidase with cupredoxin domain
VGGDSGRCEREELIEDVVLAPSERSVVDVRFDDPGQLTLEHHTPDRIYPLAAITVTEEPAEPSLHRAFAALRRDPELTDERRGLSRYVRAAPDKTVAFVAEMDFDAPDGPALYTCPMHPAVIAEEPGHCPECGMKLLPQAIVDRATGEHGNGHGHDDAGGHGHEAAGGIEWEDDMVEVNRITTPANTRWKIIDRTTGVDIEAIAWHFRVGERVKIRLVNEMDSDHPMHHPFHIHGAGRFLVLARDEAVEANLMWSDTVLVRTGETVDILLDVTNPGRWMAHCHIAEHHESGMMFSFDVSA